MSARDLVAALAVVSLVSSGCASFQSTSSVSSHAFDPSFLPGALAKRTSFESSRFEGPAAGGPATPTADPGAAATTVSSTPGNTATPNSPNAAAPAQANAAEASGSATQSGAIPSAPISDEDAERPGPEVRKPIDADPGTAKQQRVRTGLFWAGVALTAIGGATLLATGIGGRVTQGQLSNGYEDETLTHDQEKTLRDRGEVFNALAAAGAGVMIVGAGVTAITFGIDYSRCGTISKRKRKDCKRKG